MEAPAFDWNQVVLLGIAAVQMVNVVVGYFTLKAANEAKKYIAEVSVHTNSMKDALVVAAKKEGIAVGKAADGKP